jgi:serine/threonine protein kinase
MNDVHDNGLIHRDVKPANLLLGTHNELLLSDFGITVARQEAQVDTAGTAACMAPEQINGAPCYASDQYAFAVIVYEWLCGELPFSGSDVKILYQHLSLL